MKHCSTCTCESRRLNAVDLLNVLANGEPRREVYRAANRGWFVTYGGGETTEEAVNELRRNGQIKPKYSTVPEDCFYMGDTIDMARSVFTKRNYKIVYLNDLGEPK